jgi:Cysteine-rich secretory protein family
MNAKLLLCIAPLILATPVAAAPVVATQFAPRIVAAHNAWRAQAGVPPLIWDNALATGAAAWAQQLAITGLFRHSDRHARPGIGENMWYGSRGAYSPEVMVSLWGAERRDFVPGIFPNISRTGNWMDASHYTQVIWPTTQRIGCAVASSPRTDYLVCRYSPKGNVDGKPVGYPLVIRR